MPNFYDTLMSRIMGPQQNYGGLLDPNAQTAAQNDGRMAMAAQLLQAGGWSPHRVGIGQAIGSSITAGQQAQQQSLQAALQAQLLKSQIARNEKQNLPTSAEEFEFFKKLSPEDQAVFNSLRAKSGPAAIQEFEYYQNLSPEQQAEFKALQRQPTMPKVIDYEGGKALFDPVAKTITPISTADTEAVATAKIKGAGAAAEATQGGTAKRAQAQIDAGLDAADALATVKRGQQLLESIGTGGFDAVKLKATQLFGVTGADESELSANLGKAVLSQLRATFGAQFTEKEGQRLSEIEAGFSKSTEGNKRLLAQAEKILDRAARRGLKAAEESGDTFTAEEIRKSMNFSLDPAQDNVKPAMTLDEIRKKHGSKP